MPDKENYWRRIPGKLRPSEGNQSTDESNKDPRKDKPHLHDSDLDYIETFSRDIETKSGKALTSYLKEKFKLIRNWIQSLMKKLNFSVIFSQETSKSLGM